MYYVNNNIKNLYRVKFHDSREHILRLDMNENPYGLPDDFIHAVKEKITSQLISRYPEKERLLQMLAEHNRVSTQSISITSGSDEAIRLIFHCFGEAGKSIVTVSPTFEMYDVYSKMFGMHHIEVSYRPDYSLDIHTFLERITDETGIVVLLNPNSPIGECWREEEVRQILNKATSVNAITIIDEAYYYFCESTYLHLISEYSNVLILRTFSKLFSCAGLRLGYIIGNPQLIHYIENAESTFNVNNIAILFAEEILKKPDMIVTLKAIEKQGKNWLSQALRQSGYNIISKEGNFLLIQPRNNSQYIVSSLKQQGIWIRDYSAGMLAGWIRVSTGQLKDMQRFLTAFLALDS